MQKKLGVIYETDSVDILGLIRATADRWPLVWLVTARISASERQALARFGQVVDRDAGPAEDLIRQLAALGVAGLTCFFDEGLEQLAEFARALGVVHNSADAARCLVDKLAERAALEAHGLPVPRYRRADASTSRADLAELLLGITYPLVIKPATGTGGRDTVCVADLAAAAASLEKLTAARPGAAFVVEECLGPYPPVPVDGVADYVSVELACDGDRREPLAITGRMPLVPPFREGGHFIPAGLGADEAAAVLAHARLAVEALGVRTGCVHVEIKLTEDGPRVIEINGRPGGGGIRDLLCALGASDPYRLAAELAMGESPPVFSAPSSGPLHFTFALQPPLDRPARLTPDWRERLDSLPAITEVRPHFEEHTAKIAEGAYGYLALVSGAAPDRDAMLAAHAACLELIEPLSE